MDLSIGRNRLRGAFLREEEFFGATFMTVLLFSMMISFVFFPSWIHINPYYSLSVAYKATAVPQKHAPENLPMIAKTQSPFLNGVRHSYYDYSGVKRAFHHRTSLHYLTQFDRQEIAKHILSVLPVKLQKRAISYLPYFFYFSQKYKIDPYWAISIAWTESHFNFKAKSYVGANGIMQIMPRTEEYLLNLLRYSPEHKGNTVLTNIHLGIYYLSKLLKQFDGNYREATVAYNMGPGWVKRWKAKRRRVGSSSNEYLNKVKNYYKQISIAHYHLVKECDKEYLSTYVVRTRKNNQQRIQPTSYKSFSLSFAPLYSYAN